MTDSPTDATVTVEAATNPNDSAIVAFLNRLTCTNQTLIVTTDPINMDADAVTLGTTRRQLARALGFTSCAWYATPRASYNVTLC
jgi:hypothetical protein